MARTRLQPTELGLKGVLLLAALELAFLATSYSNLFFLLIAFCCALAGLGAIWGIANVAAVHVEIVDVAAAPAGSPHEIQLRVRANGRTRYDLAIGTDAAAGGEILYLPALDGEAIVAATLRGLPRGVHRMTKVRVASRFPFGVLRSERTHKAAAEAIAYPRPTDLGAASARGGAAAELAAALAAAAALQRGSAVASLRPFRAGDSPTAIHWKATARRGAPVVKDNDRDDGSAVEIVLDRRCTADELDAALAMATAVLLAANADERIVTLRSQGLAADFGPGRAPLREALRWLAEAEPLPAAAAAPARGSAAALRLPLRARREVLHA
jgi:uncharacterized protein (DUF58 family)